MSSEVGMGKKNRKQKLTERLVQMQGEHLSQAFKTLHLINSGYSKLGKTKPNEGDAS